MKSTLTSEPPRARSGQARRHRHRGTRGAARRHGRAGGVNFSVFSKHATGLDLLLFDRDDDARPARVIPIDPATNRQYHYWHVFVPELRAGTDLRLPRVRARSTPPNGHRFDPDKVLLDPYGRGVVVPDGLRPRGRAARRGDNAATAMKSVVVDPSAYDWEGDRAAATGRRRGRSSTRCTCAGSRGIRARASPSEPAAPTPG